MDWWAWWSTCNMPRVMRADSGPRSGKYLPNQSLNKSISETRMIPVTMMRIK